MRCVYVKKRLLKCGIFIAFSEIGKSKLYLIDKIILCVREQYPRAITIHGGMKMFVIIDYIGKIRDQLKRDATNYEQIFKLLSDIENITRDTMTLMKSQVKRCKSAKREMCEMFRMLPE